MDEQIDTLMRRLDAIHRTYRSHFEGQARVSRDPALLDAMQAELNEVKASAEGVTGEGRDELDARLSDRAELYEREAAAIREAQSDPRAQEVFEVLTWVTVNNGRYVRFFAGKGRASRDLGLLDELAADAERLRGMLQTIGGDDVESALQGLGQNAELYRTEAAAIRKARQEGELASRSGALAQAANDQIRLYKERFVGKSRLSRRPAVLERMIANMEGILSEMEDLAREGFEAEELVRNQEIVRDRARFYRGELSAIRDAKSQGAITDLITALAEGANAVFDEYQREFAGQDRRTRDVEVISRLIEELADLGRNMEDLQRLAQLPANGANLRLVLESLRLYEREYRLIREAQNN